MIKSTEKQQVNDKNFHSAIVITEGIYETGEFYKLRIEGDAILTDGMMVLEELRDDAEKNYRKMFGIDDDTYVDITISQNVWLEQASSKKKLVKKCNEFAREVETHFAQARSIWLKYHDPSILTGNKVKVSRR